MEVLLDVYETTVRAQCSTVTLLMKSKFCINQLRLENNLFQQWAADFSENLSSFSGEQRCLISLEQML